MDTKPTRISWYCFILYIAIFGSFCGLEIDTHIEDLPFFQPSTFLLFLNVIFVLLLPPLMYTLCVTLPFLQRKRGVRNCILVVNSLYFHLAILLLLYRSARDVDFDFYFFWYNLTVALSVLWKLYSALLIVIAISVIAFVFFQKFAFSPILTMIQKAPKRAWMVMASMAISSMLCQVFTIKTVRGSTVGFLYASFLSDRQLRTDYHKLYQDHMAALQAYSPNDISKATPSLLGDRIIFVQQESLGSYLLNPRITPQILRAARDGILFNQMYANSIQSERGYECILCGVPPSIAGDLVEDYSIEDLKHLSCLPRLFKSLGYHPILFYSGNRNPRATRLFQAIGFEKIFAGDITQPDDVMYDWGYREDHFFTRVDEYLRKHYANEKLFIFITASATNHTPFKVQDDRFLNSIPFPHPKTFEENLSNTTFVQDAYFGHLYDLFKKHYAQRASLIAVSDHAWPIPRHKNNIYNERGAYEENFLAAMLLIPPSSRQQDFAIGSTVTQRFSQMDILPTILDLVGMKQGLWLGESFAPWLFASPDRDRIAPQKTKISVQPYGGGFISAVQYPQKYLFSVLDQNVKVYDLLRDPGERSPDVRAVKDHIHLIEEFFSSTP